MDGVDELVFEGHKPCHGNAGVSESAFLGT